MFKYVFKHRALKSHLNQPWLLELSPNGLLSSFSLPSFCILLPHRSAYRITPLILKPFHGSPLTLRWNPCHFAGPSKPSAKLLNISLTLANWTLCYTLNSHCSSYLCLVLFFFMFFCDVPCSSLTVFCASCNFVQTLKAQCNAGSSTKLSLTAPTGGISSPPTADFILHFVFITKIAHFTMQLYYLCLCLF